jgi:rhomboid family GlyGly-CTERM serine protease
MRDHNKPSLRYGPKAHPGLWLMGLAALVMVLFWAGGDRITLLLQYERAAVLRGEYWRLLTGHLVHGGLRHMALNLAGSAVMVGLFFRTYSRAHWMLIVLASCIAIDAGFLWRERALESYVGLSGVLHGVLAAGTIAWWRTERRAMAIALTAITVGKLAWEQWQGPVTLAGEGMTVIVNAHLYGAIGGGAVGAILLIRGKVSKPQPL